MDAGAGGRGLTETRQWQCYDPRMGDPAIDPDNSPNHSAGTSRNRFSQRTYSLGVVELFRSEKALAAADEMEDEELIRKLRARPDLENSAP